MDKTIIAWLLLRITYAWLYIYALKSLLTDWPATEFVVGLIAPKFVREFAIAMIAVMILSALMILFGIYAQVAGLLLFIYNLLGARVHYRLAKLLNNEQQSDMLSAADKAVFIKIQTIGVAGHITSAQKNFILAAVALFFTLLGSGPISITGLLW